MSTDTKMKTCKECKGEKSVDEFAMSRRIGEKIYYRGVCKVCWSKKQTNTYTKKLTRRKEKKKRKKYKDSGIKTKKDIINKITEMLNDGESWDYISRSVGYSYGHLANMRSQGILSCG